MPTGITVDEPLVYRPKKGTYLDMWQSVSMNPTDGLFNISGSTGTILDIHMTATLGGAGSAQSTWTTTSTLALGSFVLGPMDTSNKILPIIYSYGAY